MLRKADAQASLLMREAVLVLRAQDVAVDAYMRKLCAARSNWATAPRMG